MAGPLSSEGGPAPLCAHGPGRFGTVARVSEAELPARERVLEVAYTCVERSGLTRTSVEDVARESGVSRATLYRWFPGGRDELLRETVGFEVARFFGRLAEAAYGAPDFATMLEEVLVFAHRAVREHALLQRMLVEEPELLLPLLTTESHNVRPVIAEYLLPYLEVEARAGRVRTDADLAATADYLSRMILSLISSPGHWDLEDPAVVAELVRTELLGAVLHGG